MTKTNGNSNSTPKNNLAWPFFFLIALLVLAVGVAGYFGYQNNLLVKQTTAPESAKKTDQAQSLPNPETTTVVPTPAQQGSEITPFDGTWNLYVNRSLGFSLKIPKVSIGGAPCVWSEENGDHSYRPATGPVPVKVFDEPNGVYLAHEYRYDLTGETVESGIHYFSGCEKQTNTLAYLQSESPRTWHIVSQKVTGDTELTAFIRAQFQPACRLGEKTAGTQAGVFDVAVLGDGLPIEESACVLNYRYVFKYSPEKQRAWKWDLGQAATFYSENYTVDYDKEMTESFKVL